MKKLIPLCFLPLLWSCQANQPEASATIPLRGRFTNANPETASAQSSTPQTPRTTQAKLLLLLSSPTDLKVREGDTVSKGEILSQQKPPDHLLIAATSPATLKSLAVEQVAIDNAKQKIEMATIALQNFETTSPYVSAEYEPPEMQRDRARLENEIALAHLELQTAQANYRAAKAEQRRELQQARLEQEKLNDQLEGLTVRSPYSGKLYRVKLSTTPDGKLSAELTFKLSTAPKPPISTPTNAPTATVQIWTIVPNSIHDGDTLRVSNGNGNRTLRIRFCGIDAPELNQPGGPQSRDYLRSLLAKSPQVKLSKVESDRYGRTVAEISTITGQNVNVEMAKAGQAYYYARYAGDCPSHRAIASGEQQAKQLGLGVWANPTAIKPWDWRAKNR